MAETPLLTLTGITKRFPGVVANRDINLAIQRGEIHAIVGENGAGKSTLMRIIAGLYQPDEGQIILDGRRIQMRGPRDAARLGIGMVHQHFMLIPRFTVAENIVLGEEHARGGIFSPREAEARIRELAAQYQFELDPTELVENLSVGAQQRVELLKVLYRGASIIILDEPTAVLVPHEVEELFANLQSLRQAGKTIIFISHKLDEVLEIADRITVLRAGRVIGTVPASQATKEQLAEMMVGRPVLFHLEKPPVKLGGPPIGVLEVRDLTVLGAHRREAVSGVSFVVRQCEILGVAGVEGNGQTELVEGIMGLRPVARGKVILLGRDITGRPPSTIRNSGVAFIPEDRQRQGLVLPMSVWENAMLGYHRATEYRRGVFYDLGRIKDRVRSLIRTYDVRTPDINGRVETLSGGNQQKLILAKEMSSSPTAIVASQPTRGLDVGATEFVWQRLLAARAEGLAILLVSADLEEVLALSDRVIVMYRGQIVTEFVPGTLPATTIGEYMLGIRRDTPAPVGGEKA